MAKLFASATAILAGSFSLIAAVSTTMSTTVLATVSVTVSIGTAMSASPAFADTASEAALLEARMLLQKMDYKGAVKAFRKAQKLGDDSFECCYGLARSFLGLGDTKNAIDGSRRSVSLAGNMDEKLVAHNLLGLSLFAGGNANANELGEAATAFEKVLELSASLPAQRRQRLNIARYNLGVTLLKLERDAEGVAMLEEYLALSPAAAEAEHARAYIANPRRARVDLVPDFEAVTLSGESLTPKDFEGKVVLLDFWGTWCAPCVASIPHLRHLHQRFEDSPFEVVSISNDSDGEALRSFVAERQMTWYQVWDEDRRLTTEIFQIANYPTFVVVDHQGVIVHRDSGWGSTVERILDSRIAKAVRAAKKASH